MYSIHRGIKTNSEDRETQYLVADLYDSLTNRRISIKHMLKGLEENEVNIIEGGNEFNLHGPRFSLFNRNALSYRVELKIPWSIMLDEYSYWINENIQGCWSFRIIPYVDWKTSDRLSTYMFFFQNKEDALFFKLRYN